MKTTLAVLAAALALNAQAANELKIGFLSTLSGPAGTIGVEIRDGFNLALKMAGGKLGGLPTEVVFADDTLNPEVGKQLAERLIKRDRVNLMTGVVFSNVMLAVWPTIQDGKVVYFAPNATPTRISGEGCNPYFVSASWPNEGHHEAAGHYAKTKGYKNMYLIAPNYPAGKDATSGFKRSYGGTISAEVYTKLNQLDYSAELAQIRAAKPAALYAFLPGGMGINFIKQFVAAGLSSEVPLVVPGFAADQDIIRAVGEPMLGIFDTSHWAYDLDNDGQPQIRRRLREGIQPHPVALRRAGLYHRAADRRRGARGERQDRGRARRSTRPSCQRLRASSPRAETSSSRTTARRCRTTTCASWPRTTRAASSTRRSAP